VCDSDVLSGTSVKEERWRRQRASQTPATVEGADLTVGQLPAVPDGLVHSGKANMTTRAVGRPVTIAGCSARWKPRPEARRHEYVFGREDVGSAPARLPGI
jgi:hypothetical protein